MQGLMLLVYLPQVVLVPLVANIPQALPIEVLQVSQTQAASESRKDEAVEEDRRGDLENTFSLVRCDTTQTGCQVGRYSKHAFLVDSWKFHCPQSGSQSVQTLFVRPWRSRGRRCGRCHFRGIVEN